MKMAKEGKKSLEAYANYFDPRGCICSSGNTTALAETCGCQCSGDSKNSNFNYNEAYYG